MVGFLASFQAMLLKDWIHLSTLMDGNNGAPSRRSSDHKSQKCIGGRVFVDLMLDTEQRTD
jgi:hypothetical protein